MPGQQKLINIAYKDRGISSKGARPSSRARCWRFGFLVQFNSATNDPPATTSCRQFGQQLRRPLCSLPLVHMCSFTQQSGSSTGGMCSSLHASSEMLAMPFGACVRAIQRAPSLPIGSWTMAVPLGDARHAVRGLCACSRESTISISSHVVRRPWFCSSETVAMRFRAHACGVRQGPSLPLQSADHDMQFWRLSRAVQGSFACNPTSVRARQVQLASVHSSALPQHSEKEDSPVWKMDSSRIYSSQSLYAALNLRVCCYACL